MREGIRQATLTGIVLHARDVGESSRLVEVLSVEMGRVRLLAPGARASRKRFQGVLDLFASLRLSCAVRSGHWRLEAADSLAARLAIRTALIRFQRASALTEVARALAPEHQEAVGIFAALTDGLDALDAGDVGRAALAYPRLLIAAGIVSSATRCAHCDERRPDSVALDTREGFLLCPSCAGHRPVLPAAAWSGKDG